MSIWLVAGVISTLHLEGPVVADGGDYLIVPFEVPAGTVEIEIAHSDGSDADILDWGVWAPEGFRGWGGGNTEPIVIGVDESSRSYLEGPITPGTWELVIGKAKLPTGAGAYTADVTFRDAPTLTPLPRDAPSAPTLATGTRWYAGDFHVHSEESGDARATLDEIGTLARSRGLDFVVITDHNTVSQDGRIAAAQPDHPDLLFVRGIEVTTYAGHGNAIGATSYVDHRAGLDGVGAPTILDEVTDQGAVFSINHPALQLGDACIGCAWRHDDTPWDQVAAIEIHTGNFEVTGTLFTPQAIALWDEQLAAGYALAAIGGSDDHTAGVDEGATGSPIGSPTTMVLADALSEAAILDAIRAGRTVVKLRGPDDPMAELTSGDARIGDTVTGVGEARLTLHVTGGDGTLAQVWRDGALVEGFTVEGDDWTHTVVYPVTGERERYRIEIVQNRRVTVTSHLYVEGDPSLADGGGCCSAGGGGAAAWLVLVLGCGACRPARRKRPERNPRRRPRRPPSRASRARRRSSRARSG
jgi:hypothetical protein